VRGHLPFDGSSKDEIMKRTISGRVNFKHACWESWSPEGVDFIRHLIQVNPAQRLSARRALQHPWLAGPEAADSVRAIESDDDEDEG
jgi:serine/threonine protein kinase